MKKEYKKIIKSYEKEFKVKVKTINFLNWKGVHLAFFPNTLFISKTMTKTNPLAFEFTLLHELYHALTVRTIGFKNILRFFGFWSITKEERNATKFALKEIKKRHPKLTYEKLESAMGSAWLSFLIKYRRDY